ncbi:MAG: Uma2 family endonuclease [Acidobacteriota bacterium]
MSFLGKSRQRFGWDDYRAWEDGERWELIGGKPFSMSPAPSSRHQTIVGNLFGQLYQHFQGRQCRPFVSPIDVKLSAEDVVQPDIAVVCDPNQVQETHVEGPPTLAIEVLSPSTHRHDRVRKLRLYARAGIQEYWLVQPYPAVIEVLGLTGEHYQIAGAYTDTETLTSPTFPDLALELSTVFTLPIPPSEQIDEIRESAPPYDPERPVH